MHCSSCGHDLRPGARFCDACGHAVGADAVAGRRLSAPVHLAEKVLASRGRLEGERKLPTSGEAGVATQQLADRVELEDVDAEGGRGGAGL